MLAVAAPPVRIHAVDTASGLDDEVLQDERVRSVIADIDGAPAAHLLECHRILKPGGLLVLAHSDWDTALFTSDDDALTRQLVDRFVSLVPSWAERSDGFMGRKLLGLAADSPFEISGVHTW